MTILDFLRVLLRRWWVVLLGLALTGVGALQAAPPLTVYSATTTVNVLPPDVKRERILGYTSPDAIHVANVLAARVNGGVPKPLASSPDVKLAAAGVTRGVYATVRNEGGQWRSNVPEPIVQVQVVDTEPELVLARMNAEIAKITEELVHLESQLKVPAEARIQLEVNPKRPNVDVHTNYPSRALLGYGAFGLGLTMVFVAWLDRRLSTGKGIRRFMKVV